MTTTLKSLAVVLASAALVAGCSSADTKNDYVDTVNEIQNSALTAFNTATATTPSNQEELVAQLQAGEQALADAVAQLDEVEVPSEAEADHPPLVEGIDKLRELFADTAAEAEKGGADGTLEAVTDLTTKGTDIGSEIDEAISRINDALGAT